MMCKGAECRASSPQSRWLSQVSIDWAGEMRLAHWGDGWTDSAMCSCIIADFQLQAGLADEPGGGQLCYLKGKDVDGSTHLFCQHTRRLSTFHLELTFGLCSGFHPPLNKICVLWGSPVHMSP